MGSLRCAQTSLGAFQHCRCQCFTLQMELHNLERMFLLIQDSGRLISFGRMVRDEEKITAKGERTQVLLSKIQSSLLIQLTTNPVLEPKSSHQIGLIF